MMMVGFAIAPTAVVGRAQIDFRMSGPLPQDSQVSITNAGEDTLTVSSISLKTNSTALNLETPATPFTLDPTESSSITLTLSAPDRGANALIIESNDFINPVITIPIVLE